jgi:uncharacterized membrane protein YccC
MTHGQCGKVMKAETKIALAFVAGMALAILFTLTLRSVDRARMMGEVICPTQAMLGDILQSSREGKQQLVSRKLEKLHQILMDFRNNGTAPETSVSKITEMK